MRKKRFLRPWIMVLPSLGVILAVVIFPLLYSLRLSFIQWDALVPGQKFVGFRNFLQVITDTRFLASLGHTGILLSGIITIEFLLGFLLALCLLEEFKLKKFVTAMFILPVTIIPTVAGFIWKLMLDAQYGPVNHVLSIMLRRDIQYTWLAHTNTAYISLIVTDVWQWTPFMILVLLAGLVALPKDALEAAEIDGASEWQKVRFITLPMLKPVIVVALLIRSLDSLKLFDIVFAMTQGGPGTSTETLSYYIYRNGFEYFRMGYTAAMSYVVLAIVSTVITLLLERLRETT
uniref:Sugar ABC transporter permease n=1 Tax=Candidatus Caldatribacterium saccharofermentans TaxID=1454753 RepID=A0A7V4TI25_9BACT